MLFFSYCLGLVTDISFDKFRLPIWTNDRFEKQLGKQFHKKIQCI